MFSSWRGLLLIWAMRLLNIIWASLRIGRRRRVLLDRDRKRCLGSIQVQLSSILLLWSQVRTHTQRLPRRSLVAPSPTATRVWGLRVVPERGWFQWILQQRSTMGSKPPSTTCHWATHPRKDLAHIPATWLQTYRATTTPATSPTSRRLTSSWATKLLEEEVVSFASISNLRVTSSFSNSNNKIPAAQQLLLQAVVPWVSTKLISRVLKEIVDILQFWKVSIKENKWFSSTKTIKWQLRRRRLQGLEPISNKTKLGIRIRVLILQTSRTPCVQAPDVVPTISYSLTAELVAEARSQSPRRVSSLRKGHRMKESRRNHWSTANLTLIRRSTSST